MGSPEYHDDIAGDLSISTKPIASANNKEFPAVGFRKGTKCNKNCYSDLKDDEHFNIWNRGFVSTAYTHHTQLVLDKNYKPKTETEKEVFQEMRFFMHSVFEEKLKSDKGKSLVQDYEDTRDSQALHTALKLHAKQSTAAHISVDTL
jgi:hypothetical protein